MAGLVAAAFACGGSDKPPLAGLAEGCLVNTDCNAPLVCAFRKCHEACVDSRDCKGPGQRCVSSDRPYHVCQLVDERNCTYNSDCGGGQTCGVDFQCRDQCNADRDCLNEQLCVAGSCAEIGEVEAGALAGAAAVDAGNGQRCLYTSECAAPLVCRNHFCGVECRASSDCAAGVQCVNNRCVVGTTAIGTGGGVLTAASGRIALEVPAGALSGPVSIAIFPLEAWPRGALGPVFEIVPSGTVFTKPATLTYHYEDADLGAVSPDSVRVALATGAAWQPLASTVDVDAKTVTTTLQHLSVYGLVGPDGTFAALPDAGSRSDASSAADVSASDGRAAETSSPTGAGGSPDAGADAPSTETGAAGSGSAGFDATADAGNPVDDDGSTGSGGSIGTGGSLGTGGTMGTGGSIGTGGFSGSGGSGGTGGTPDIDATIDDAALESATNDVSQPPTCFVFCDQAQLPCSCSTTCVESTYSFQCDLDVNGAPVCVCSQNGTQGPTFPSDVCDPNLLIGVDPGCGYLIQIAAAAAQ